MGYSGYEQFLQCKRLARYEVIGRTVLTDNVSYRQIFGGEVGSAEMCESPHLKPFQYDLLQKTLATRKYAHFWDCGLGKTTQILGFAHTLKSEGKVLILSPLAVIEQIRSESVKWYDSEIANLRNGDVWEDVAIVNYEHPRKINMDGVKTIILDESSILKNATGEIRNWLIGLSANTEFRLCTSATPAPNNHAEYASHAVFLGMVSTSKEFYAKYFRKNYKDKTTSQKWVISPYAVDKFYSDLSTWATFLQRPSLLGYTDTTEMPSEPDYIYQRCSMTSVDNSKNQQLSIVQTGQDFKALKWVMGAMRCDPTSDRTRATVDFVNGCHSIVWCARNEEEKMYKKLIPDSVIVSGSTPVEKRVEIINQWRKGNIAHLISKPKVLGFGVNLPECDVMAFPGFTYSFEQFYQAVRRGHRFGRTGLLKVLIPYTYAEDSILQNLRNKIASFETTMEEIQERVMSNE